MLRREIRSSRASWLVTSIQTGVVQCFARSPRDARPTHSCRVQSRRLQGCMASIPDASAWIDAPALGGALDAGGFAVMFDERCIGLGAAVSVKLVCAMAARPPAPRASFRCAGGAGDSQDRVTVGGKIWHGLALSSGGGGGGSRRPGAVGHRQSGFQASIRAFFSVSIRHAF